MKKIFEYFTKNPLVIVGILLAVFLAVKMKSIRKRLKDFFNFGDDNEDKEEQAKKDNLKNEEIREWLDELANVDPGTLTINAFEAQTSADIIYDAMAGMGSNFDIVKSQIENKTNNDLKLIVTKFFMRSYLWFPPQNIFQWFVTEFEGGELDYIREVFSEINDF
jgi:hypothetical protein